MQAADDYVGRLQARDATESGRAHTHTHTHAHARRTHTHTQMHIHTHALYTHTFTHTHTHTRIVNDEIAGFMVEIPDIVEIPNNFMVQNGSRISTTNPAVLL